MSASSDEPFELMLSKKARDRTELLLRRAQVFGILPRVATAFREIDKALKTIPLSWGDPIKTMHGANMVVYRRIHDELVVIYAVHEAEKLVWLHTVTPVLGHPLLTWHD